MSFSDYWYKLVSVNPNLKHDENKMELTVAEFRRCMKNAYKEGRDNSFKRALKSTSLWEMVFGRKA